jgi:hypothetical protein
MNEDATHVHYAMSLDARASCVLTTFELRPFLALGPPVRGWPLVQIPLAPEDLRRIRFGLGSIRAKALSCGHLSPGKKMKMFC